MGCGPAGSLYLSTGSGRWPRPPWVAAATTDALPGRRNHGCSRNARKRAQACIAGGGRTNSTYIERGFAPPTTLCHARTPDRRVARAMSVLRARLSPAPRQRCGADLHGQTVRLSRPAEPPNAHSPHAPAPPPPLPPPVAPCWSSRGQLGQRRGGRTFFSPRSARASRLPSCSTTCCATPHRPPLLLDISRASPSLGGCSAGRARRCRCRCEAARSAVKRGGGGGAPPTPRSANRSPTAAPLRRALCRRRAAPSEGAGWAMERGGWSKNAAVWPTHRR